MTIAKCLSRIGSRFLVSHLRTHTSQLPTVQPGIEILRKKAYKITKRHEMGCQRLPKWSQKLPKAPKRHPRAPQRLPKGAQVGPKGSQESAMEVPRAPQGVPRGPQGSQVGSKTSPRGAPGERSWNLLLGVPKKKHQNTAK